uniref:PE-PGRS family protein n=1 Tax=Parastrongyloides trichosuri TaxID=131310 RepID=A0A0N4ZCV6_PARTI
MRLRGRLRRRGRQGRGRRTEERRRPAARKRPLPQGRRKERSGVCRSTRGQWRHLCQRRLLGGAPRPRLDRRPGAPAAGLCRRADAPRAGRPGGRARRAQAPGAGHRRRLEGLDQARPAEQPRDQAGPPVDRRRHGQYFPGRARDRRRRLALRARPGRHRPRDHGERAEGRLRAAAADRRGDRAGRHGPGYFETASGSRGRARLRGPGVQYQQYGTGAGDHGGRRGHRLAGDHAGLARGPLVRQRHRAEAPDRRDGGNVSAHPDLHAPGPWQQRSHLRHGDPVRLHLGDDGRFAEGRR